MFLMNMSQLVTFPVNTEIPHYRAVNIGLRVICLILKTSTQKSKKQTTSNKKKLKKKGES